MKVRLKSKLGRPFWRFGAALSPDRWTSFDLSDEQIVTLADAIKVDADGPRARAAAEGGAIEIEPVAEVAAEIPKARLRLQAIADLARETTEAERVERDTARAGALAALKASKAKK